MDRSSTDNQLYRRGQALGFTLAELFTLLLFLVLLILAGVQQHEKSAHREITEKWDRIQQELENANKKTAALAEKDRRLRGYFGVSNDFGDDFNDLVPAKGPLSDRKRQQILIEKAQAADEVSQVLNASSGSSKKDSGMGAPYESEVVSCAS